DKQFRFGLMQRLLENVIRTIAIGDKENGPVVWCPGKGIVLSIIKSEPPRNAEIPSSCFNAGNINIGLDGIAKKRQPIAIGAQTNGGNIAWSAGKPYRPTKFGIVRSVHANRPKTRIPRRWPR